MLPSPVLGIGLQYPSKSPSQLRLIQDTITRSPQIHSSCLQAQKSTSSDRHRRLRRIRLPSKWSLLNRYDLLPYDILLPYLVQFSWQTLIIFWTRPQKIPWKRTQKWACVEVEWSEIGTFCEAAHFCLLLAFRSIDLDSWRHRFRSFEAICAFECCKGLCDCCC